MRRPIWKGPGYLGGLGSRESVAPGDPIPEGHVTEERLKELGGLVEYDRPTVVPKGDPEPKPGIIEAKPPSPAPKRGPGRPRKGKNR